MNRKIERGLIRKERSKGILVFFPNEFIPHLDEAVKLADLDRSKFIRAAVREKLKRHVRAS